MKPELVNKEKENRRKKKPANVVLFKKILEMKETVSKHVQSGGSLDDLKKQGFKFGAV